jgi:chitin disaccharide deacetylase
MIVCADDYGLRDDINRAILELTESCRLSAVSCMVSLARCTPDTLAELHVHRDHIDIGLHLCLTDEGEQLSSSMPGRKFALPSFGLLLRQALLGRVRPRDIALQVSDQYDRFVEKCGRQPDYIDGHLHAHQLPGVRRGLLDFLLTLPPASRPYVRNTRLPVRTLWRQGLPWTKASFIGTFGARLWKQLHAASVPTNDGFAGIYDFRRWSDYQDFFPRFLACLPHANGILVTHPGSQEEWRKKEFSTLRHFQFRPGSINRFGKPGCNC